MAVEDDIQVALVAHFIADPTFADERNVGALLAGWRAEQNLTAWEDYADWAFTFAASAGPAGPADPQDTFADAAAVSWAHLASLV